MVVWLRTPVFWDMVQHLWVIGSWFFEGTLCPYLQWSTQTSWSLTTNALRSAELQAMTVTGETWSTRTTCPSVTLSTVSTTQCLNIHCHENLKSHTCNTDYKWKTRGHFQITLYKWPLISLKTEDLTCSWDPYQHRWSWCQNATVTGLQGTLWMPSSGQLAIYCNQAKSFHLEYRGPESCRMCSYLMQKNTCIATGSCLYTHKNMCIATGSYVHSQKNTCITTGSCLCTHKRTCGSLLALVCALTKEHVYCYWLLFVHSQTNTCITTGSRLCTHKRTCVSLLALVCALTKN
jgi:hypothetical protein